MNIRPSRGYCRNDETLIEENLQNVIFSNDQAVPFSCYLGRKCEYRLRPTVQYSARDSSHSQSLAVADFNSDGQMDIAFVDPDANSVGILLGYGTGEFSPPIIYSTGVDSLPTCVVAGDFNSDGRVDIAVANSGASNVGIFLNNDNGDFSSQTTYFTGTNSGPFSVALADLNNDDQLDIVVGNFIANNIGVLLGSDNGEFSFQTTYFTGENAGPRSVTTGDLDKDGRLDIAIALVGANSVGVLLGYGNGKFSSQTTYFIGPNCHPLSIVVDDLNDDGCADICVANYHMGSVGVLFGMAMVDLHLQEFILLERTLIHVRSLLVTLIETID